MRIAVVGLGFMGSTHLKGLHSVKGATLGAVVSADPKRRSGDLSAIQGNLGGPGEKLDFSNVAQYETPEQAFADPNIDAVDLCVPTDLHKPLTLAALKAGKHVLVEKPMALSLGECSEMLEAADAAGKILMVAQVLRFFPAYAALRAALRSGGLGAVRSALFRRRCAAPAWSKWLKESDKSGGGVFDLLIHDVDMVYHLFGMPEAVTATGYENLNAGIDVITANFHYAEIGSVVVTGGWHHPKAYPFSMEYTVSTDGGTLDYSTDNRPPKLYKADGEAEELQLDDVDGYAAEIQYFADCVNENKKPVICSPVESALSVRLALAMNESRAHGGSKVQL
ncbi:MAG: Gfo/Idh/MocA family oxidoreductase [Acidobacteria bacterium]|nr:Gfo/Idh/MocA family oxidoreductase [Acidobacteriota bacterium]